MTRRNDVLPALRDPALISILEENNPRNRRLHELIYNPRESRRLAETARGGAAAVIEGFIAAFSDGDDAVAALHNPLANAMYSVWCAFTEDDFTTAAGEGYADFRNSVANLKVSDSSLRVMAVVSAALQRRIQHEIDDDGILSRLRLLDPDEAFVFGYSQWFLVGNLAKQAMFCLYELVRRPCLHGELRDRPELIREFVEESLRLEPTSGIVQLVADTRTMVAGVDVPPGAEVTLCVGAVNRDGLGDPPRGDDLVLDGKACRHWSFAGGAQRCRGSHLVREMLRVWVEEWVKAVESAKLVPGYRPVIVFADIVDEDRSRPIENGSPWLRRLPLCNVALTTPEVTQQ